MPSRDVGLAAEQRAKAYLQQQGLTWITSNYQTRFGEIDLIMQQGKTLVFAEVRLRSRSDFGGALASITPAKQAKLIKTAQHYLTQFSRPPACRFDAVLLGGTDSDAIEWIQNAFSAD